MAGIYIYKLNNSCSNEYENHIDVILSLELHTMYVCFQSAYPNKFLLFFNISIPLLRRISYDFQFAQYLLNQC